MSGNKPSQKGLGRGLSALLGNISPDESIVGLDSPSRYKSAEFSFIDLNSIQTNPYQPRNNFEEIALNELMESIKQHGIIQPITVRKIDDNTYQLISGERRVKASQMAGLTNIPAYIRTATDLQAIEMALIENIQREDLNPIEIALSLQRLLNECNITQENLAEKVAKSRSVVTNYLRLLKLGTYAQKALISNQITFGHARALVAIEDVDTQESLVNKIINQKLSVRQTEDMLRKIQQNKTVKTIRVTLPKHLQVVKQSLTENLKTKVDIKYNLKGKGNLIIQFKSEDELNRILSLIKK
ncbi:MAG TPA: ParB/RepB/Spo0J family partition protein [Bacteroidales bacterium]|jgi:ParB family chromosome partitioning protein|nr:ParB/RepB/Spo0J family partition protein [Bacteroidales bacterium]HOF15477.1 ParB/RepB/Spo0J family partition protein [Bacteroidales bacterium]HON20494.1 ParB/RepB/Spo0J family partition protein [Bacteroidales bacterium]HOR81565.1 ParB/RepB/Spo0J family partition protein [Bacteroidales bacterium]HPJ90357.1 ParB/RepB/Spo0J family partition protein [Bacteroidales bacterium]